MNTNDPQAPCTPAKPSPPQSACLLCFAPCGDCPDEPTRPAPAPYAPAAKPPPDVALAEISANIDEAREMVRLANEAVAKSNTAINEASEEIDYLRAELRAVLDGLRSPLLEEPAKVPQYARGVIVGCNYERRKYNEYAALKLMEFGFPVEPMGGAQDLPEQQPEQFAADARAWEEGGQYGG